MTLVHIPGKRTSGRYVYRRAKTGPYGWIWQCDLHGDEYDADPDNWESRTDLYGYGATFQAALDAALAHAVECPYDNEEE